MLNRLESEIVSQWNDDKPLVSVCTLAYNHEHYISDALDSFLMQETDFAFEIVIGEDCSNDNTRAIIDSYVEKYPKIIKLITSKENVGMQENGARTIAACQGSYVALCDGDDYWTDSLKLKKQIHEMEKYPEVNASFHAAHVLFNNKKTRVIGRRANKTTIFKLNTVIVSGGSFCPTASLIIKKEVFQSCPHWVLNEAPVGDYFFQMIASEQGILYLDQVMCVYRMGHSASWTSKFRSGSKLQEFIDDMGFYMKKMDQHYHYSFSENFNKAFSQFIWKALMNLYIPHSVRVIVYRKYKHHLPLFHKLIWQCSPWYLVYLIFKVTPPRLIELLLGAVSYLKRLMLYLKL